MRDRPTARVLLFGPDGRILLVRGRMIGDLPARWFTPGGGMEPGETAIEGAIREVREETGLECVSAGPVVWLRKGAGRLHSGELVMFRENFVLARCESCDLTRAGWEPHEVELMDDMRWWTIDELADPPEPIMPEGLHGLLQSILAGEIPETPLELPDWNTV